MILDFETLVAYLDHSVDCALLWNFFCVWVSVNKNLIIVQTAFKISHSLYGILCMTIARCLCLSSHRFYKLSYT